MLRMCLFGVGLEHVQSRSLLYPKHRRRHQRLTVTHIGQMGSEPTCHWLIQMQTKHLRVRAGHELVVRVEAAVTLSIGSHAGYARIQGSKRCARTDRHAGVQGWVHLSVPSARVTWRVILVRE